jgi:hypothetical protein
MDKLKSVPDESVPDKSVQDESVPDEERVIESVLEGKDEDFLKLLAQQPSLINLANDVKSISEGLKSIEDKEPPPLSVKNIPEIKRYPFFSWLQDLPLEWYKNPYILSFGFVMAIVFLCFFMIVLLKF